jgi:hypothetical protein
MATQYCEFSAGCDVPQPRGSIFGGSQHAGPGRVEYRAPNPALMATRYVALANRPHGTIRFDHGLRGDYTPNCLTWIGDRLEADRQSGAEVQYFVVVSAFAPVGR